MARLDFLVEQLWASPLADERLRLAVDEPESPDWRDVESYWLVPHAQRGTLLVPPGHPRVTAASLDEYRSLRPIHVAAAKRAGGLAARARMPASRHRLSLRYAATRRPRWPRRCRSPPSSTCWVRLHSRRRSAYGPETTANRPSRCSRPMVRRWVSPRSAGTRGPTRRSRTRRPSCARSARTRGSRPCRRCWRPVSTPVTPSW